MAVAQVLFAMVSQLRLFTVGVLQKYIVLADAGGPITVGRFLGVSARGPTPAPFLVRPLRFDFFLGRLFFDAFACPKLRLDNDEFLGAAGKLVCVPELRATREPMRR